VLLGEGDALNAESAEYVETLARTLPVKTAAESEAPAKRAALVAGGLQIILPLDGLADSAAEQKRAAREAEQLDALIARSRTKLANRDFLAKAPPAVVKKEKTRLEELLAKQSRLAGG